MFGPPKSVSSDSSCSHLKQKFIGFSCELIVCADAADEKSECPIWRTLIFQSGIAPEGNSLPQKRVLSVGRILGARAFLSSRPEEQSHEIALFHEPGFLAGRLQCAVTRGPAMVASLYCTGGEPP